MPDAKATTFIAGETAATGAEAVTHPFILAPISGGQAGASAVPMFISAIVEVSVIPFIAIAPPTCTTIVAKTIAKTLKRVTTRRIKKIDRDGSRRNQVTIC